MKAIRPEYEHPLPEPPPLKRQLKVRPRVAPWFKNHYQVPGVLLEVQVGQRIFGASAKSLEVARLRLEDLLAEFKINRPLAN